METIFCHFLMLYYIFLSPQVKRSVIISEKLVYLICLRVVERLKGTLSGLAIESPLKMMKNAFYFTSKALLVLKIFKVLS